MTKQQWSAHQQMLTTVKWRAGDMTIQTDFSQQCSCEIRAGIKICIH